jgi:hypothetical protein
MVRLVGFLSETRIMGDLALGEQRPTNEARVFAVPKPIPTDRGAAWGTGEKSF